MAFTEDMTVFFDAAAFAVAATFTPLGGATVTENVIFDSPTQALWTDDLLSNEYAMTFPAAKFPGLKSGDIGTVNGTQYKIREIRLLDDGMLKIAKLSKA